MPAIVKPEASSHWYTVEGRPCYEVECKSKPGTMRNTNLRDARKMGLVPSVTSILSIMAKPGLEAWKQEQAIMATATLPQLPDETSKQWLDRVVLDMHEQSRKAMHLGSDVHDACEKWLTNQYDADNPCPLELREYVMAFDEWYSDSNIIDVKTEAPFACLNGYGGRVDIVGSRGGDPVVVDIKTQSTANKNTFTAYDDWGLQLIAYADGLGLSGAHLLNVVISTDEPGKWWVKEWTNWSYLRDTWNALCELWFLVKKYDPRGVLEVVA